MRMLRLAAYLGVVFVVVSGVTARAALGRAKGIGLALTSELDSLAPGPTDTAEGYALDVNGARLFVNSSASEADFQAVLDHFEGTCRSAPSRLVDQFVRLRETLKGPLDSGTGGPMGLVLRESQADRGMIVCLAGGAANVLEAARLLAQSGDLSRLGGLRALISKRTGAGSHTLAVWSEGPVMPDRMFPEEGDAPGSDVSDAPRPPGKRILSAAALHAPHSVRVYALEGDPAVAIRGFEREMLGRGWHAHDSANELRPGVLAFGKGGRDLFVTVDGEAAAPWMSVVEMGAR